MWFPFVSNSFAVWKSIWQSKSVLLFYVFMRGFNNWYPRDLMWSPIYTIILFPVVGLFLFFFTTHTKGWNARGFKYAPSTKKETCQAWGRHRRWKACGRLTASCKNRVQRATIICAYEFFVVHALLNIVFIHLTACYLRRACVNLVTGLLRQGLHAIYKAFTQSRV